MDWKYWAKILLVLFVLIAALAIYAVFFGWTIDPPPGPSMMPTHNIINEF